MERLTARYEVLCKYLHELAINVYIKILSFKDKAPTPKSHHKNSLHCLYASNVETEPKPKKLHRHIPSAPEKILDAPGMKGDYYLNLLDWGNNSIFISQSLYFIIFDKSRCSCCCFGRLCVCTQCSHRRGIISPHLRGRKHRYISVLDQTGTFHVCLSYHILILITGQLPRRGN